MMGDIRIDTGTESKNTSNQNGKYSDNDVPGVLHPDKQQLDEETLWKDKYVRLFADLENTKKRLIRSSAQEVELEKKALLQDVLPVADGLDLALMHTPRAGDNRSILQGIDLVRDILNKFFIKNDVTAIDALGKPFDPRLHEAIGVMPHPRFPPNTVVKVEQKGYLYGEKLLRPAQVVVTPT
jgi:molecular chaperone GrpE